jgi:hypothetical protein
MADVSIYVALIAAGAGVIGAAIPQTAIARQARRDKREREATAWRSACLDLLGAVGELRTQIANNFEYHGSDMAERLAQVRRCATAAQQHATEVSVSWMVPRRLVAPAQGLAAAASRLAVAAASETRLDQGAMVRLPDFTELEHCADEFRRIVIAEANGQTSDASLQPRPAAEE